LLSAQKADTLKHHHVTRQFALPDDYAEEVSVPLDTASSLYHRNRRSDKYSSFNAYPGNYGLPLYQINFFDRITDPNKFLYRYLYPFMHMPDNALFINTQVPFTEMVFSYAGQRDRAEQTFRVRHSQNINRFMNFGLVYDIVYSLGQYSYQRSADKTFALHFSYTGDKYKAYFQTGINNLLGQENGGIVDKTQLPTYNTKDVEVNMGSLNAAQNNLKNWNLLLVQKLVLGKPTPAKPDSVKTDSVIKGFRMNGVFSHIFTFETGKRSYTDAFPGDKFYTNIYLDSAVTFDTLSMRVMNNTLRFDFSTDERRKFRLGGGVGIRNEQFWYTQGIQANVTPHADSLAWHRSNNVLVGRLFNNIGNKFRWEAEGELYFSGYRVGDFNVKGIITRDFDFKKGRAEWDITGGMNNTTPSEWYERWIGNNFIWNNSFSKEFRIDAGTEFLYPARMLSLRFNYAIINNYTYFGPDALPAQFPAALSVAALTLKKEVSAWKLHLDNEILMQVSNDRNVVDLPLVTLRSALYFQHNIHFNLTNGDLLTQIGFEVLYNTPYNGYEWMPATATYYQGQFNPAAGYLPLLNYQPPVTNQISVGNYPYLNAFLDVKLKRTRIFVMFEHFNSKLTGYDYFMVPGYPMNIRWLKWGFAWTFYN
jgi:hypothetical protein